MAMELLKRTNITLMFLKYKLSDRQLEKNIQNVDKASVINSSSGKKTITNKQPL